MAEAEELRADDLDRASRRGLTKDEVQRQLSLLRSPPPSIQLERACTVGDGIEQIPANQVAAALEAHAKAAEEGRLSCFVPASGAATRMFKSLLAARSHHWDDRTALESAEDGDAMTTMRFLEGVERFAFAGELARAMQDQGRNLAESLASGKIGPILDTLLAAGGLDLASLPKGLLPFHRYAQTSRTAFEEHLVEGFAIAGSPQKQVKLHFTVGTDHVGAFETELQAARKRLEAKLGASFQIEFSTQDPATDTIAVDADGAPFRTEDGILFRPGGHGSLLNNLAELARKNADLVFVKNIDNVVHDDWREEVVHWRRVLCGRLVLLQTRLRDAERVLQENGDTEESRRHAAQVLETELGIQTGQAASSAELGRLLNRPTRVCAVVRAEGDPGGGPFWVRSNQGPPSRQIVETAQIDQHSPEQTGIQAQATHFNPADMVLGLKDADGKAFDLTRHVDQDAVFIAEKSSGGRSLRALEHPGLWNGGMADWNTLFVEVPAAVFQPVKALPDLLARAHQPAP